MALLGLVAVARAGLEPRRFGGSAVLGFASSTSRRLSRLVLDDPVLSAPSNTPTSSCCSAASFPSDASRSTALNAAMDGESLSDAAAAADDDVADNTAAARADADAGGAGAADAVPETAAGDAVVGCGERAAAEDGGRKGCAFSGQNFSSACSMSVLLVGCADADAAAAADTGRAAAATCVTSLSCVNEPAGALRRRGSD